MRNVSRGLFNFSPLRLYFELEFASAQSLILFFQETGALKDGVLSLGEHSEDRSLGFQCLDTLPQSFADALGFSFETKICRERFQLPFETSVYRSPNLHRAQFLYQEKLTGGNQ